jgi:RNA polymerase sigma-70 factor (ECF subfamily)
VERSERAQLQGWMVRLADGDRAAFHPLFAALWPLVRGFTARMLATAADADDAAQETLVKVFRRATDFDRSRDAVTWTLTLAAYECLTLRRRAARRQRQLAAPAAPDARPTAEELLIARDLELAAAAALGELRAADRDAILAALSHGRGERPPVGAAMRKRLQRALVRLRASFGAKHGAD